MAPNRPIHDPSGPAPRLPLRLLSAIGRVGVRPDLDPKLARHVTICNYAAFGHVLMTLPYYWILEAVGARVLSLIVIPLTAFFAALPLLNHWGLFTLSRLSLITIINVMVYIYAASLGTENEVQNVFFYTLIAPLMLFRVTEWRSLAFLVAQPVALWALLAAKGSWFIPQSTLVPGAHAVFAPAISCTAAVMLLASCLLFALSHHHSEARLVAARESAERSNLAKGRFLATMSHEIRTPMNGLFGTLQLLMATNPTPRQQEHLDLMKTSGDALLATINDILDFSKIESGKLELEARPFDLKRTVDTCLNMIRPTVREKGISLECVVEPGCPMGVIGDETRYRQVLLNLLNNAVKFTPAGSVRVALRRTGGTDEEPEVTVSVRDSGIGIPAASQGKLFQAFSQVDSSTTRRFGGTGLGLAISQRLARQMRGDLRVESAEGEGSTFHFSSRHRRVDPPSMPRVPDTQGGVTARFAGRTALVVEDNRINQKVARDLLGVLGFEVEVADNGALAVDMVAQGRFDVVFMDCQMPVMDGYEATRAIRAARGSEPGPDRLLIIAMTANSMPEDRDRCLEAGMDDFIAKPILLDPLVKLLKGRLAGAAGLNPHGAGRL